MQPNLAAADAAAGSAYVQPQRAAPQQSSERTTQHEEQRRTVLVVAVALIDTQQRVLLAQRPQGKAMAGLWEFPGGKVEQGEAPEAALVRELQEELGIQVRQPLLRCAPRAWVDHSPTDPGGPHTLQAAVTVQRLSVVSNLPM